MTKSLDKQTTEKLENSEATRRNFLRGVGLTATGAAGAAIVAGSLSELHAQGGITDFDILNFALNLEYLEAEFYTVGTTGKTIEQLGIGVNGVGTGGPTTGGKQVSFPSTNGLDKIIHELAFDEQQHVKLLRTALGGAAIAKPAINLDALGAAFYSTYQHFLVLSRAFEDVGVTAYGGAAPLITSKEILATAARIALTEAEHAGNIRLNIALLGLPTAALDALDVLPPPAGTKYFSVDNNALTMVRTPSQVLAIVYGNSAPGTAKGAFFPNGVNGHINKV